MTIYKINDNKLDLISKEDIQLEKHLQKLTEENLELLFNLKFIRSEYQLNKLRPDTLAFNEETNSFVILEYKKDSSFSLIDQGYAYLALLLNNKAEFVLAYNENTRDGYMNNCVFLGDSRTVAMVSYGFVSDSNALAKIGISHWQVLSTTFTQNSGNKYTLSDYLRAHSEPVIYVCYGVNGLNGMPEDKYESTYTELVDRIIELAGDRHIVLMSIWPVDDNGRYRGSVKNEWVDKYNEFLYGLAVEKGLHYLDVASILKDDNGSILHHPPSGTRSFG